MTTEQARFEARELGAVLASLDNKEMATGVVGTIDLTRMRDCLARMQELYDVFGTAAHEAFAAGYDEAIDFSLNSDWRLAPAGPGRPSR